MPVCTTGCALLLSLNGLDEGGADGSDDGSPEAGHEGSPDAALISLGCFSDMGATRDLPFAAYYDNDNDIEGCVRVCTSHGYLYAGLQDGIQCYCGDSYGGSGPSTDCTIACPGNPSEMCGGAYANSIYRTSVPMGD
jgi:hypothetical protein